MALVAEEGRQNLIEAVASLRPHAAAEVLAPLSNSDDEDIADAVFEAWAVEKGAEKSTVGVSTGVDEERTIRLYRRLGYEPTARELTKVL